MINGSAFYLEDFPGPRAIGSETCLPDAYGLTPREFESQIWWPQMEDLAEEYGLRYTGMVMEQNSTVTAGPFARNDDLSRYRYAAQDLLGLGGELGLHGYDHMPLVLPGFDFGGAYRGYMTWNSLADMGAGLDELGRFCAEAFPAASPRVYAPPFNILSEEARVLLGQRGEQIRAIAAYLPGELLYEQEFEVAPDGIGGREGAR